VRDDREWRHYDDIVDWGKAHLSFQRGFAEFRFGIPSTDWLRTVMNRIDPDLFMDCFPSWVAEWPDCYGTRTSMARHHRPEFDRAGAALLSTLRAA
jgi:DDE_Tnp_1-associated